MVGLLAFLVSFAIFDLLARNGTDPTMNAERFIGA
jgi:hypothetical protein